VTSLPHHPFRFGVQHARAASAAAWRDLARKTEDLGYSTLLIPDHFGDQFAPAVALQAVADATTTLRVGPLVVDNDFRHPAVLAKEWATLDVLSDGRVELGIGAGWHGPEYEATGIPFASPGVRVGRLEETVAILKALWSSPDRFTFAGEHYALQALAGRPQPAQRPHPPLLIGGGGPRMLRLAAREADIVALCPVTRADGSGVDVADGDEAGTERKLAVVREAAGDRFATLEINTLVFVNTVTDDTEGTAEEVGARLGTGADEVLRHPHLLVGSVASICETLRERRERFGISYVVIQRDMEAFAPVVAELAGT